MKLPKYVTLKKIYNYIKICEKDNYKYVRLLHLPKKSIGDKS